MDHKTPIIIAVFLSVIGLTLGLNGVDMSPSSLMSKVLGSSDNAAVKVVNYAVKKGDTFSTVMTDFGFSQDQANQILSNSKDTYDFTGITTGNLFQFVYASNTLKEVRYDINKEDQVVVSSSTEGFKIKEQDINYDTKRRTASGEINRSLFLDATEAGLEPKTILELAEIFAWDVDFAADIRKGDEFSLVYRDLYRDGSYIGPGRILAAKFKNKGNDHFAFYFEKDDSPGKYYDKEGRAVIRQFLKSPLNYSHISSGFSYNRLDPVTRSSYGAHRAIDYAAAPGTPVSSTGQGTVAYAGWGSGLGRYVKVRHGGVYDTVYAHLSGIARGVYTGGSVSQGQIIGYVGSTGYATGPHLHYEMRKYGSRINPLTHDLPPGEPIPDEYKQEFQNVVDKYEALLN